MKCIIIDDEEMCRINIRHLCAKVDRLSVVGEFGNPTEALAVIEKGDLDVIFLDLHMPEISGIEFLKNVSSLPQVVITTTDTGFALDAYEFNVTDYLIKPVALPRFLKTYNKISERLKQAKKETAEPADNELFITVDRRLIRLPFDQIQYIEATGDYINIKTADKRYLTHSTLKKIESKLPSQSFLKIHRSYIVQLSKIEDIEDSNVIIAKNKIPISRSQREPLLRKLNLL
jgi:DNA-binding LytR/AlgR family response regulator